MKLQTINLVRSTYFKVLCTIFVLAALIFYSFKVGLFTVKHLFAVVLFATILLNIGKFIFRFELGFKLYGCLIIYHLLVINFNGDVSQIEVFDLIFGKYLIWLVTYIFFFNFFSAYSNQIFFIKILLFFAFINSLVTILQFFKVPYVWNFTNLLFSSITYLDEGLVEVGDTVFNGSLFGIVGNVVYNGYLLSAILPFCIYFIKNYSGRNKIFYLVLSLLVFATSVIALVMLQQRTALMIGLAFLFLLFVKKISISTLAFCALSVLVLYFSYDAVLDGVKSLLNVEYLRIEDLKDMDRASVYTLIPGYLAKYYFFGGISNYYVFIHPIAILPHNIFLNSFIYFGLIGFCIFFYLTVIMMKTVLNGIKSDGLAYFSALAFFGYWLNGLTHNLSIVTGDIFIWVLYLLLFQTKRLSKNRYA
ncbi:MAG: hypothetical protein ABI760_03055 [Ferruginibacter sp.]